MVAVQVCVFFLYTVRKIILNGMINEITGKKNLKVSIKLHWGGLVSYRINYNERTDSLAKKVTLAEPWRSGIKDSITEGDIKH